LKIVATDSKGNSAEHLASSYDVIPDTDAIAPTAPVITTTAATVNSDYYTITGTVTADATSRQTINVYGGSTLLGTTTVLRNGTTWSVVVELPQDAATTFTATSTDTAENTSGVSNSVIITESATAEQGTGSFGIISKTMTKMTGTADNSYANGWEWIIRVTLPTDQNSFALKFNDWVSGANTMAAGENMQYYSEQIASGVGSSANPIEITAANTYPSEVVISTDVDPTLDGIQTDIHVQVKIPATTPAGSYSTSFQASYDAPDID